MQRKMISSAALAALVSLVACGSSSDGGGSGGGGLPNCSAECDAQAAGCPSSGSDYVSMCKQLCAAIPSKCKTQEEAYAPCVTPIGFQCSTTVTINGKPAPESKDSSQCTTEMKAYTDCLSS